MPIKSFRGKIADEAIDTIVLHTNNGSTGYTIKKFELIGTNPGATSQESTVKIFSVPQTGTPTGDIDLSDNTLLAVSYYESNNTNSADPVSTIIIDNMIFNQDIYLTHLESQGSSAVNYYLELEQIKLDLNENTVATLKDIRNIESQ